MQRRMMGFGQLAAVATAPNVRPAGLLLRQVSRNLMMVFFSSLHVRQLLIILLQQLEALPPTLLSCLLTSDYQKTVSSQQPMWSFQHQNLKPRHQLNL